MALVFDEINRTIIIEVPQTEVTIQNLINAIRDWEGELINLDQASPANASGKQDLGSDVQVGITLELTNNWRIQFEDRSGPDYVSCRISGGNLVATNDYDNNPIKASAFTQIYIAQSSSATAIEAGGVLTDEEHNQLMDNIALEESIQGVKKQVTKIKFGGQDVKATLNGEHVTLDAKIGCQFDSVEAIKKEAKIRIERLKKLDARQELIDDVVDECNYRIEEERKRAELDAVIEIFKKSE